VIPGSDHWADFQTMFVLPTTYAKHCLKSNWRASIVGHMPTETRRDRQRRELTEEIVAIARRQLAEGGRAGVSWRAIAREVGMNPASLYTYFANIDELFTAMILESSRGLARALEEALAEALEREGPESLGPPIVATPGPLVAVATAYRRWAAEHPAQYNLVFTDQIPGYAAPPDGPTVEAEMAIVEPLVRAFGLARGEDASTADAEQADPREVGAAIQVWGVLHGLVSLEINHHIPIVTDPESLVVEAVRRAAGEG
jgi:AcrR family transcriptional regulator